MTKFMAPPYNEEDFELIIQMAKCDADASESWSEYPCSIKGVAGQL